MPTESLSLAVELADAAERAEAETLDASAEAQRLLRKHPSDELTEDEVADVLREEAERF